MMNGEPVEITKGDSKILAVAVRGSNLGNPVTRYFTHDGERVFSHVRNVRPCPVFGPAPHVEFYACACGFRRARGSASDGVHKGCP